MKKFIAAFLIFYIVPTYALDVFSEFERQDKIQFNKLKNEVKNCIKNWNFKCAENKLEKMRKYITSKKDKKIINELWNMEIKEKEKVIYKEFSDVKGKDFFLPNRVVCKDIGRGTFYKEKDEQAAGCLVYSYEAATEVCRKLNSRIPTVKNMYDLGNDIEKSPYYYSKYIKMYEVGKGKVRVSYCAIRNGFQGEVVFEKSDYSVDISDNYNPLQCFVICVEK